MDRFLLRHDEWNEEKLLYAREIYKEVASAITKWVDDCGLFIFGFLLREFWICIREVGRKLEDEIWVASLFHSNINIMKPRKEFINRATLGTEKGEE